MMNASWHEAVTIPAEVMYRDFAFNKLEHQMAEQAENLKDAKNHNGIR
jgi:hypothetical protein